MHFTPIRQENCDSKKPGQRPSIACDSVPQGRLSRSEWRTVDPVAQRSGLSCSGSRHQTFITVRLDDVASREAVKFNAEDDRGQSKPDHPTTDLLVEIPLDIGGQIPTVEVVFLGERCIFAIDTGSPFSIVDRSYRQKLGQPSISDAIGGTVAGESYDRHVLRDRKSVL